MLKTRILHPEILRVLGSAGHGARVLIADGNYPYSTEAPAGAVRVFLNLRKGMVRVADVLDVLADTIPIEAALLMEPADGAPVPLQEEFHRLIGEPVRWQRCKRGAFYAEAKSLATVLVIATGEEQRFANVLLTIGVVSAKGRENGGKPARAEASGVPNGDIAR